MSKTETPVSGGGPLKGAPDGVSGPPSDDPAANIQGRTEGGESGGGAYPNPHTGKKPTGGGFFGHGGQTEMAYYGGGQAGEGGDAPNAAAGSDSSNGTEKEAVGSKALEYDAHPVVTGGRSFDVLETSGVAQAEATGKIGTDAPYEREQESPGSG